MLSFKKTLAVAAFAASFAASKNASAQYIEGGLTLSSANYVGDLEEKFNPSESKISYGLFYRKHFSRRLAVRASLTSMSVSGRDSDRKKSDPLQARNLSFRSDIVEASAVGEFNLLKFDIMNGQTSAPFVFAGVSAFHFNPQADYKGRFFDLQPLGTEGQTMAGGGKKYKRMAFAVPVGAGFRFAVGKRAVVGLEFSYRKTFTDYLDDVSKNYPTNLNGLFEQNPMAARLSYRTPEFLGTSFSEPASAKRGDPSKKDNFFTLGASVSFNLTDRYGLEWNKMYRIWDDEIAAAKAKKAKKTRFFKLKKKKYVEETVRAEN